MSDDDAPATIHELRMRMRQLHQKCGAPTAAAMRKSIKDFTVPRLAPASLSEFLSNKRPNALPKQDFLRGFVAACLLARGDAPDQVTAQLRIWDNWWTALVLASGAPPATIAPRAPAAPANDDEKRPRRSRPMSIIAGLLVGIALGVGATLAIPALFRIPDVHQRELRTEVGPPPTRPTPGGPCPSRQGAIRNSRGQPAGSIFYNECDNQLQIWVIDNLADGYCIFSVIHWTDDHSSTTSRTCLAGQFSKDEIRKETNEFWIELVALDEH